MSILSIYRGKRYYSVGKERFGEALVLVILAPISRGKLPQYSDVWEAKPLRVNGPAY